MDDNKKLTIQRWLIRADHDLKTAQGALSYQPDATEVICFHAQQCVEKCLKAYIVSVDEHVEKTHYLTRLVERCTKHDPEFSNLFDVAAELADYAVETRYPDDWREIPFSEAEEAVEKAEKVMVFVKSKLATEI